jgi:hypothetical protein
MLSYLAILLKMSLNLPEGFEFIAGSSIENIHLYYHFIQTVAIADAHRIDIVLRIPLKTSNRQFNLYKIVTLPIYLSNHSFIHYVPEFSYFGIDTVQHNYILFTESEYRLCKYYVLDVANTHVNTSLRNIILSYNYCTSKQQSQNCSP